MRRSAETEEPFGATVCFQATSPTDPLLTRHMASTGIEFGLIPLVRIQEAVDFCNAGNCDVIAMNTASIGNCAV